MFLTNHPKNLRLSVALPVFVMLVCCVAETRGQPGSNRPTMRDTARAIQRAELDRLLRAATPAQPDTEQNRAALQKQIREDFKELQELNNKMMATAWADQTLDYSFLSDMVSRIRGKALRLKTNLNLPSATALHEAAPDPKATPDAVSNAREFRRALLLLDQTVMRFVNNPLFQTPNMLEVNLATQARHDIEAVIALTADLKKTASRLRKTSDAR